jgi:RNA recognition motif-containing protein
MKVYIGNLASATNESDIEQMLVEVEKPTSVKLIKDRYTGESRGFAFVEFTSQEKGNQAIRTLDGHSHQGSTLKVNEARERRDDFSRGGRW